MKPVGDSHEHHARVDDPTDNPQLGTNLAYHIQPHGTQGKAKWHSECPDKTDDWKVIIYSERAMSSLDRKVKEIGLGSDVEHHDDTHLYWKKFDFDTAGNSWYALTVWHKDGDNWYQAIRYPDDGHNNDSPQFSSNGQAPIFVTLFPWQ